MKSTCRLSENLSSTEGYWKPFGKFLKGIGDLWHHLKGSGNVM
jgi:hypothetical protein